MRRPIAFLSAALTAAALALVPAAPGLARPAGPTGGKIVLETDAQYSGYDVAIDRNGIAYVGWISSTAQHLRLLHLCVLPPRATSCLGGIKTVDPLGPSSASALQVLANPGGSGATLVWYRDTDASVSTPFAAVITTAQALPDGTLGQPVDYQAGVPSFGSLKTAIFGPDGRLWFVVQANTDTPQQLYVYNGTLGYQAVTAPFFVNRARLAFSGATVVLAVDYYGQISKPIAYASAPWAGGAWSGFDTVARTWNVASFDMVASRHGIRLVASVPNASYRPAIAKWDGDSFKAAQPTGEREACPISSHDLVADPSGRVTDFGNACEDLRLSNLADSEHSAYTDFPNDGTVAGGDPQVATIELGTGWVVWGIESSAGNQLAVMPVLLPALLETDAQGSFAGKVWVEGPATCLPPVNAKVAVKADPKPGWKVASKKLELGNQDAGNKIDGADLKPGKAYVLTGTVRFVKVGTSQDKVVTVDHKFRTCND